jgi:hypothetical protein
VVETLISPIPALRLLQARKNTVNSRLPSSQERIGILLKRPLDYSSHPYLDGFVVSAAEVDLFLRT